MVKNITPLVCLSVLLMDVVAGILGIQAEIAQNKVLYHIYTIVVIEERKF